MELRCDLIKPLTYKNTYKFITTHLLQKLVGLQTEVMTSVLPAHCLKLLKNLV